MATLITLTDGTIPVASDFNTNWVNLNTETRAVNRGGTGAATFTTNGVLLGNGTAAITATAAGTANQVLRIPGAGGAPAFGTIDLSQAAAVTGQLVAASFPALTGDITTAGGALATTLANTGPGATGPIGSATVAPVVTIDAQGRVTALTSATITAAGLTRAGGNTTEGTTTTASGDNIIITVSSLSIAVGTPFLVVASIRKSAGAANTAQIGLRVNSTNVLTGANWSAGTDAVDTGTFWAFVGSRGAGTDYLRPMAAIRAAGSNTSGLQVATDANFPNAEITSISILGASGNAAITMGVDEVHVYTLATS